MYLKYRLLFLFLGVHLVYGKSKVVTVKVDSQPIVNSLRTVFSAEYLDRLADIISKKAAKYFVIELFRNLPKANELNRQSAPVTNQDAGDDVEENRKEMNLDKREALQLISDPSPDGDNLDIFAKGLSKEQTEDTNKKVPVIGLMKINGVYFRRLLGMI